MNNKAVLTTTFAILGVASLAFLAGCGGGAARTVNNQPPPVNNQPPAVPPQPTGVSVSPPSVTVPPGGVQQFIPTVTPSGASQAVTWSVSGTACTGESCGTIDATGRYIAAAVVSNPLTVTVTATSVADPTKSASAKVSVETSANNAKLSGQYALLLSGFLKNSPVAVVGSFIADGNGNLVGGNMDITWNNAVYRQSVSNSTYSIGPDSRGTMRVPGPKLFFTFSFTLDSFSPAGLALRGRLIDSTEEGESGSGFLVKQDPAAFSTAAINGGYAFGLSGAGTWLGTDLRAAVGRFTASGGSLTTGHVDLICFSTCGTQADLPFTGSYSVDATGRGEATLDISGQSNPSNFILYVVSTSESLWMDASGLGVTGRALQQSGGAFSAGSLKGTSVFGVVGGGIVPDGNRPQNDVNLGEFEFDGTGNVSGTGDENYFGIPMPGEINSGTYTVDSNGLGRGELNYACGGTFYLISPGRAFLISGCDAFQFGTFEPQIGGPFSNASFSGNYALGTLPLFPGLNTNFADGMLTVDGTGNLNGTLATNAETQTFTGTYSVAANGRVRLSITPTSGSPSILVFYLASSSEAFGLQMDLLVRTTAVYVIEKK